MMKYRLLEIEKFRQVVWCIAAAWLAIAAVACSERTELESQSERTRKYLSRQIATWETGERYEDHSVVQSRLPRFKEAVRMLEEHPHMPSKGPYPLSAVFAPENVSVNSHAVLDITWLQRDFGVKGVYLKDAEGRIAQLVDEEAFRDRLENGSDDTFYRGLYVTVVAEGEVLEAKEQYPVLELPADFTREGMQWGLIGREGNLHDALQVLKPDADMPEAESDAGSGKGTRGRESF